MFSNFCPSLGSNDKEEGAKNDEPAVTDVKKNETGKKANSGKKAGVCGHGRSLQTKV